MTIVNWAFDGLLGLALIVFAVRILFVTSLFHAVVLFICLGLIMALTWVRLDATDVALAEAGIGAALTGVLLVDLLHRLRAPGGRNTTGHEVPDADTPPNAWLRILGGGLAASLVFVLLLLVVAASPRTGAGLASSALERMDATGVTHVVTAVLLDFRSLDTFLELTVLFVAVIGMLAVRHTDELSPQLSISLPRDTVFDWMWRLLLPLLALVAGYLLWLGSFASGGAFQSGILLSAMLILLSLTGQSTLERLPEFLWRALIVSGLITFLAVGAGTLALGRQFLDYPPEWASGLIFLLEFMATLTIGMTLVTLVLGLSAPMSFKRSSGSS